MAHYEWLTIPLPPPHFQPSTVLAQYYDAVKMYATVVNETLDRGDNPFDGLAITKRLWNRTFDG